MIIEDADGIYVVDDAQLAADVERLFVGMASPAVFNVDRLREFAAATGSSSYVHLVLVGITHRWADWFVIECPDEQLTNQSQRLQAFAMTCRLIRMQRDSPPT
ncbi:hypothetical protein B7R21_09865 [Subtercola boreus]|uniref:Uncharacterized protein n=1 Tax=Subtercola boreus TaxID=120213 RepID=A0A3E0VTF1_9MICO|nr:hypothetical protein [Subtercola boreus]RFA12643.1 hypothetical protein B7R21_09865 [Subtercola boreus]